VPAERGVSGFFFKLICANFGFRRKMKGHSCQRCSSERKACYQGEVAPTPKRRRRAGSAKAKKVEVPSDTGSDEEVPTWMQEIVASNRAVAAGLRAVAKAVTEGFAATQDILQKSRKELRDQQREYAFMVEAAQGMDVAYVPEGSDDAESAGVVDAEGSDEVVGRVIDEEVAELAAEVELANGAEVASEVVEVEKKKKKKGKKKAEQSKNTEEMEEDKTEDRVEKVAEVDVEMGSETQE
jgi:hypothetical protein